MPYKMKGCGRVSGVRKSVRWAHRLHPSIPITCMVMVMAEAIYIKIYLEIERRTTTTSRGIEIDRYIGCAVKTTPSASAIESIQPLPKRYGAAVYIYVDAPTADTQESIIYGGRSFFCCTRPRRLLSVLIYKISDRSIVVRRRHLNANRPKTYMTSTQKKRERGSIGDGFKGKESQFFWVH